MGSTHNNGAETAVFSDDGGPSESAAPAASRRRWPWVVAIAATAVAAATAGVLVAGSLGSGPAGTAGAVTAPAASAPPATEPGRAPSVNPSVQPTVQPTSPATSPATKGTVAGPTAGRYNSAPAGVSFDLPDGWTAEESTAGSGGNPGTRIIVFNEARMQVAELYHGAGGGVGGACGPGPYPITELDTAAVVDSQWAAAAGVRFS